MLSCYVPILPTPNGKETVTLWAKLQDKSTFENKDMPPMEHDCLQAMGFKFQALYEIRIK